MGTEFSQDINGQSLTFVNVASHKLSPDAMSDVNVGWLVGWLDSSCSRELFYLHSEMPQGYFICYYFRNCLVKPSVSISLSSQLSCAASSRAVSPLVVPGDFSQPASPFGCLDNSAAKHKLGLRHKACNKRKPISVRHSDSHKTTNMSMYIL